MKYCHCPACGFDWPIGSDTTRSTPWISVDDHLPTNNTSIMLAYDGVEIRDDIFYLNGWMKQSPMDYWGAFHGRITHWIPYPQKPDD